MPATATRERLDVYGVITNKVCEALKRGIVPWHKPWAIRPPTNLVSKKPYRGGNVWLLSIAGHPSPWWMSFKQARELGGNVKAGEHGWPCYFWKFYDDEEATDDGKRKKVVFRYYTVFNATQCEGLDAKVPQEGRRDAKPIEECEKIVLAMPRPPAITEGNQASYSPREDKVTVPPRKLFTSDEEYYSALFHELVHATGHHSRLGRYEKDVPGVVFGSESYSQEELVAEMGATFLCGHAGIAPKVLDNSAAYIQNWLKRLNGDTKFFVKASSLAQKAVDHILNVSWDKENEE